MKVILGCIYIDIDWLLLYCQCLLVQPFPSLITHPHRTAFNTEESAITLILEQGFVIDLVLSFFHAYMDSETFEVVSDVRDIARHYLK